MALAWYLRAAQVLANNLQYSLLRQPDSRRQLESGSPVKRACERTAARLQLLIVDELGFVPLSKTGAELLLDVFGQRYECGSVLVTSNLPFDRRVDRGLWLRTAHRCPPRPPHPSRQHPGNERGELPAHAEQASRNGPSPGRRPPRLVARFPSPLSSIQRHRTMAVKAPACGGPLRGYISWPVPSGWLQTRRARLSEKRDSGREAKTRAGTKGMIRRADSQMLG